MLDVMCGDGDGGWGVGGCSHLGPIRLETDGSGLSGTADFNVNMNYAWMYKEYTQVDTCSICCNGCI